MDQFRVWFSYLSIRNSFSKVAQSHSIGTGRENWPIKIIETAGRKLERALVKSDPFGGNKFEDKTCIPNKNPKNTIGCRGKKYGS